MRLQQEHLNKLDYKRLNRMAILRCLTRQGAVSRVDLARQLQVTRAVVSLLTGEMMEEGLLYEQGEEHPQGKALRGRKKILLNIRKNQAFLFGMVLDGDRIWIGLTNLQGETLERCSFSTENQDAIALMRRLTREKDRMMQNNCLKTDQILGIGITVSDRMLARLGFETRQECFEEVRRAAALCFEEPVVVGETTDGLLLAELYFSPERARRPENLLLVRYDYNLDAAVLIQGELYHGAHQRECAGWLSHVVVDPEGELCSCGKWGCCGTKMSMDVLIDRIRRNYGEGKTPLLAQQTGWKVENVWFDRHNLAQLMLDAENRKVYQEALAYLVRALDNVVTVLDPEQILLFGFVFDHFLSLEDFVAALPEGSREQMRACLAHSSFNEQNLHLAGSALAYRQLFLDTGGRKKD